MSSNILLNANFKKYWISSFIAHTGNFVTMVSMPWLVLEVSNGNPIMLTLIIALLSLPQAALMLLGGAVVDKFSALSVLRFCRLSSFLVMLLFFCMLIFDQESIVMIAIFSVILGFIGGLNIAAGQAIIPDLLQNHHIAMGNGIVMSTIQMSQVLGPLLAGWMIWLGSDWLSFEVPVDGAENLGVALAFLVDAVGMGIAFMLISSIEMPKKAQVDHDFFKFFSKGVRYCFEDEAIRTVVIYLAFISFFLQGPLATVIPLISKLKFDISSSLFGLMFSAFAVGIVIGAGISVLGKFSASRFGLIVLFCDFLCGLCFFSLGLINSLLVSLILILLMGVFGGVIMISGTTWFQLRAKPQYLGRVMGVVMFSVIGLIPISSLLAGSIADRMGLDFVPYIFGGAMMLVAVVGLTTPKVRAMESLPRGCCDELI